MRLIGGVYRLRHEVGVDGLIVEPAWSLGRCARRHCPAQQHKAQNQKSCGKHRRLFHQILSANREYPQRMSYHKCLITQDPRSRRPEVPSLLRFGGGSKKAAYEQAAFAVFPFCVLLSSVLRFRALATTSD